MRSMKLVGSIDRANAPHSRRFLVEGTQQMFLKSFAKESNCTAKKRTFVRSRVRMELFVDARPKLRTCRLGAVESLNQAVRGLRGHKQLYLTVRTMLVTLKAFMYVAAVTSRNLHELVTTRS